MTIFTDNMTSVATRLLTSFGESVTFTRKNAVSYNPDTSEPGYTTTNTYTARAYPENYTAFEIANTVVEEGDIKLVVGDTTTLPLKGDTVDVSSREYRVETVERISASGIDIIYILQVKI